MLLLSLDKMFRFLVLFWAVQWFAVPKLHEPENLFYTSYTANAGVLDCHWLIIRAFVKCVSIL